MRLWRISNYVDLTGEGGRRAAGRWHDIGTPVVYLAESPALAMMEVLVHLEIDPEDMPSTYQLLGVDVLDSIEIEEAKNADLDKNLPGWRSSSTIARKYTTSWFKEKRTALLRVPSVIVPYSSNFILNPAHPHAASVKIVSAEKADYDQRLFPKGKSSARASM